MKKFTTYLFLILVLSALIYYAVTVFITSLRTPKLIDKALRSPQISIKLSVLSEEQKVALLAVCDPNFYSHKGIDLITPGAGGATITQNLVRVFYFDDYQPGIAKIRESLIAHYTLNRLVAKDDQLTLFINHASFGQWHNKPVVGFANATQIFFEKPFRKISKDQYLSLVAMLIDPDYFNVKTNPKANADRVRRIKSLLTGDYTPKSLVDLYYGGDCREDDFSKTREVINNVASVVNRSASTLRSMANRLLALTGKKM